MKRRYYKERKRLRGTCRHNCRLCVFERRMEKTRNFEFVYNTTRRKYAEYCDIVFYKGVTR